MVCGSINQYKAILLLFTFSSPLIRRSIQTEVKDKRHTPIVNRAQEIKINQFKDMNENFISNANLLQSFCQIVKKKTS